MKLARAISIGLGVLGVWAGAGWAADWVKSGDAWEASSGDYTLSVLPKKSGKIAKFQYRKQDVIRPGEGDGAYFWPAPQHAWNWPPPASFTDSTYAASVVDGELLLVGPANPASKLRVTKRFAIDTVAKAVAVTYTTKNTATDSARHFAPWEISRGYTGSLLFFPKASPFKFVNPSGSGLRPDMNLSKEDSIGWYLDDGKYKDNKFFRDGAEGWLAQLKDSLLFVKTYPDVDSADFAPWESDVEVYTGGSFIENEVLGPWTAIRPGDSLVWTVRWNCKFLSKSVDTRVGSSQLMAEARALVASGRTSVRPRRAAVLPGGIRPLVDVRGRLLPESVRGLRSGSLGVLPLR